MLPHAPAVPWPPVSVIEPAISPISGSLPIIVAKPTPTKFCTRINAPTTTVNTISGRPPALRREKSALRPMEVKKTSIKAVCSDLSNWKLTWNKACRTVSTSAASRPLDTGSGMLKSRRNLIFFTISLPMSRTMVAAIRV